MRSSGRVGIDAIRDDRLPVVGEDLERRIGRRGRRSGDSPVAPPRPARRGVPGTPSWNGGRARPPAIDEQLERVGAARRSVTSSPAAFDSRSPASLPSRPCRPRTRSRRSAAASARPVISRGSGAGPQRRRARDRAPARGGCPPAGARAAARAEPTARRARARSARRWRRASC